MSRSDPKFASAPPAALICCGPTRTQTLYRPSAKDIAYASIRQGSTLRTVQRTMTERCFASASFVGNFEVFALPVAFRGRCDAKINAKRYWPKKG